MTLLTVADFKQFNPNPGVEDDALQLLLDAAEDAIVARYGPVGASYVETVDGGYTYIFLRRRATAITGIVETVSGTDTTLAADDYRLRADGVSVRRLGDGTNWRSYWGGPVAITYVPADDTNDRMRVQLELVKSMLTYEPGTTMEQIGAWLEQKASNSVWNTFTEREAILNSLLDAVPAPGFA
jgi:hypothetical protein